MFPIVFFSRGFGRSHAVVDIAVASELKRRVDDVEVRFASYGTGADTFRRSGLDVIDLQLPEDPPFLPALVCSTQLLADLRPNLVIAHEEYAALPAAEAFKIPSLFVTGFFHDPFTIFMQALRYASEVIFIERRGMFTEPPFLKGKIHYVGPVLRQFKYNQSDRGRAREELGLSKGSRVVVCLPGSRTEAQTPITELLIGAFDMLQGDPKHLFWVAGRDHTVLSRRFAGRNDVTVLEHDWQIDRLIVASDLVVTKATRSTMNEVSALGTPSISLSHGINWPDDVVANHTPSNVALDAPVICKEELVQLMEQVLSGQKPQPIAHSDGASAAADRIVQHINIIQGIEK